MTRLIREALVDATRRLVKAGVGSPALDAQILLSHAMGINKCTMLARSNEKLNEKESINIDHFITRREKREPVAYITGKKEFFSINFTICSGKITESSFTNEKIFALQGFEFFKIIFPIMGIVFE